MKKGENREMKGNETPFFSGEYRHSLDPQRRIAIPSCWRTGGLDRFYLLPGRFKSLQLMPFDSFRSLLEKAAKISFADANASLALARLGSMAQECVCDKQGRIPMPQSLIDHAGLKDQAVLVGALTTIQIWLPENWMKHKTSPDEILDTIQKIQEAPDDLASVIRKLHKE